MTGPFVLYADPFWVSPYVFSAFVSLKEKGVPFEVRTVNLGTGEHRQQAYRGPSLTARVPALQHGDFWLSESSAIAEYIEDLHPGATRLFPSDPRARARARQMMAFIRSDLGALREERSAETVFYRMKVAPLSPAAVKAADKLIHVASALVSDGSESAFGSWSIADADLAMVLQRLVANGDPVPEPLRAYAERQWARPSVRAYVDHERAPFVPYNY
jgi:glutathione S-transferase